MKIKDFIEYMTKNTNRTMKEDQVMSLAKKTLEVKKYLAIGKKRDLVNKIINDCVYYDNGIYKIDGIEKYVYFTMYIIDAYTNLELGEDIELDFDLLSESDILPVIVGAIGKEYDDVNILLQLKCDDILMDNSVEAQCGKLCNHIVESIDELKANIGTFTNDFNKEDWIKMLNMFKG